MVNASKNHFLIIPKWIEDVSIPLRGNGECKSYNSGNRKTGEFGEFQSPCGEMVNARNEERGIKIMVSYEVSIPLRGNGECKGMQHTGEWNQASIRFNPLAGKW